MHDQDFDPPGVRPLLDSFTFVGRMAAEVARLRRKGSLLSLVLFDVKPATDPSASGQLQSLAERLRSRVRLQDVLAMRTSSIAVLMPDTSLVEAARAAERLLHEDRGVPGGSSLAPSAGLATIFGEVEGGYQALVGAAEDALAEAGPGHIARSRVLQGRPRVLVIDDDLAFAQMLAETISERGWEGHPCSDTGDAGQRVLDGSYSALFIDLQLVGASGVKILREALASQPRRPAVLMSGSDTNQQAILDALGLGPVMFVRKPISPAALDSALQMFRDLLPGAPPWRRLP